MTRLRFEYTPLLMYTNLISRHWPIWWLQVMVSQFSDHVYLLKWHRYTHITWNLVDLQLAFFDGLSHNNHVNAPLMLQIVSLLRPRTERDPLWMRLTGSVSANFLSFSSSSLFLFNWCHYPEDFLQLQPWVHCIKYDLLQFLPMVASCHTSLADGYSGTGRGPWLMTSTNSLCSFLPCQRWVCYSYFIFSNALLIFFTSFFALQLASFLLACNSFWISRLLASWSLLLHWLLKIQMIPVTLLFLKSWVPHVVDRKNRLVLEEADI